MTSSSSRPWIGSALAWRRRQPFIALRAVAPVVACGHAPSSSPRNGERATGEGELVRRSPSTSRCCSWVWPTTSIAFVVRWCPSLLEGCQQSQNLSLFWSRYGVSGVGEPCGRVSAGDRVDGQTDRFLSLFRHIHQAMSASGRQPKQTRTRIHEGRLPGRCPVAQRHPALEKTRATASGPLRALARSGRVSLRIGCERALAAFLGQWASR